MYDWDYRLSRIGPLPHIHPMARQLGAGAA